MSISPTSPSRGFSSGLCQSLLVLTLAYGALLRANQLVSDPGFVSPDALRHFIAAEELHPEDPIGWFSVYRGYAPFAWVLRLVFGISSHQPIIQRLVTVVFSVLVIWLVARIVQARLGNWAGLLAAYLTAINPALIESSDSGIREDPYVLLWLTLFYLVFVWQAAEQEAPVAHHRCSSWPSPSCLRRVVIGLVTCLLVLVRVDSLLPLTGFVALVIWTRGIYKKPMEWLQISAPVVILSAMVLISNGYRHEDPFYFVDREKNMFRYWANLEFQGCPGFPTVAEVRANSRTGEALSAFEYFGHVLGWRETAQRYLKGYAELMGKNVLTGIYRFDAFPGHISIAGILTLLGMGVLFYRRQWVLPVLIPLLFSGTAWTYNIVGGHDFRFFLVAVPFAIMAACEGAAFVSEWICRIPHKWLRRMTGCLVLAPVLLNPWNHDLKTSFPWRVGPVTTVPEKYQFASDRPSCVPTLVGREYRCMGPLGFLGAQLVHLAPRQRFLARTWWRIPEGMDAPPVYRVVVCQEPQGLLSSPRYHPLTRKYPLRYWRPGQIVLDEVECLVYSGLVSGTAEVRVEVSGGAEIEDATYTTVFTQP